MIDENPDTNSDEEMAESFLDDEIWLQLACQYIIRHRKPVLMYEHLTAYLSSSLKGENHRSRDRVIVQNSFRCLSCSRPESNTADKRSGDS